MRLLIIEDEPRIADLVKAGLARAGFAVDVVAQCADARLALAVTPYDAAVVDLGLPDGDGVALVRELRTKGNQLPVLMLTARDTIEDRVCGLDSGADDYLVSILEQLMRRLGRVVPKAILEEKLYGIDDEHESNTIPVHVHYLRRK